MKVTFKDDALRELYVTQKTSSKKYKDLCKDKKLIERYVKTVSLMETLENTARMRIYSFLHYEKLRHQGDEGRSSVRLINGRVERLIFTESPDGIEVELIEINATHYGNKK